MTEKEARAWTNAEAFEEVCEQAHFLAMATATLLVASAAGVGSALKEKDAVMLSRRTEMLSAALARARGEPS